MIRPILACVNPYETAKILVAAGWHLDFSQPQDSGDPLVGVSLLNNSILLGVTDGYVPDDKLLHLGTGVEIYMTVPLDSIHEIYKKHLPLNPTELQTQPWGDLVFEFKAGEYQFMVAAVR